MIIPHWGGADNIRVIYDKTTDLVWIDTPLYEWVDLGLPSGILWADRNVGAKKPEDVGLYFAWGETEGYRIGKIVETINSYDKVIMNTIDGVETTRTFDFENYKYSSGNKYNTLTKYNTDSSFGYVDNLTLLEMSDDAAYQSNNTCRMPSYDELEELINNTERRLENGCVLFTSKINGKTIKLPNSGYISGDINDMKFTATIWTNTLWCTLNGSNSNLTSCAKTVLFNGDSIDWGSSTDFMTRSNGLPIRAVKE